MPQAYTLPTSAVLMAIEQAYLVTVQDDPIYQMFPRQTYDTVKVLWEQKDNYTGLQAIRGIGGQPQNVRPKGYKRYEAQAGVYGDFSTIDEETLTEMRQQGTFANPTTLDEIIADRTQQLVAREDQRIRLNLWTLLTTGTFSVYNRNGSLLHTDTYPIQKVTPSTAWTDYTSSTPLTDLRAAKQLAIGYSTRFDTTAKMFMSTKTLNIMLANNNANFGERKLVYGGNIFSLEDVQTVLAANDLPPIVIHDEGYYDDSDTFQQYLPLGKIVVCGRRNSGTRIGEYQMVRNANNPDMAPGSYFLVTDSLNNSNPIPRQITVHKGHNGGPAIMYPSSVVALTVA